MRIWSTRNHEDPATAWDAAHDQTTSPCVDTPLMTRAPREAYPAGTTLSATHACQAAYEVFCLESNLSLVTDTVYIHRELVKMTGAKIRAVRQPIRGM